MNVLDIHSLERLFKIFSGVCPDRGIHYSDMFIRLCFCQHYIL